jgi:hypothetical protein
VAGKEISDNDNEEKNKHKAETKREEALGTSAAQKSPDQKGAATCTLDWKRHQEEKKIKGATTTKAWLKYILYILVGFALFFKIAFLKNSGIRT